MSRKTLKRRSHALYFGDPPPPRRPRAPLRIVAAAARMTNAAPPHTASGWERPGETTVTGSIRRGATFPSPEPLAVFSRPNAVPRGFARRGPPPRFLDRAAPLGAGARRLNAHHLEHHVRAVHRIHRGGLRRGDVLRRGGRDGHRERRERPSRSSSPSAPGPEETGRAKNPSALGANGNSTPSTANAAFAMGSPVAPSRTNPRNAPRVATVAAAKIPPRCSRHNLLSSRRVRELLVVHLDRDVHRSRRDVVPVLHAPPERVPPRAVGDPARKLRTRTHRGVRVRARAPAAGTPRRPGTARAPSARASRVWRPAG